MVGKDSLASEHLARLPDSLGPPKTLSNTPLSLTTPDGLSTLYIAWWYAPYLYGKYNISFDFSETGLPPFCSAT